MLCSMPGLGVEELPLAFGAVMLCLPIVEGGSA
jgi:hypothetical protein